MPQSYRVVQDIVDCHYTREYVAATANGDDDRPRLAVKQYIPIDNPNPQPGDVTLIAAHANGFPKELYEPLWDDLHRRLAQSGTRIRSIWIADMWNQGQSGVLNEKILGDDPSWFDHARDMMNLINLKRDEMPHPLVGIGHSMGGAQISAVALMHPRLFHSVILLDPVMGFVNSGIGPAVASTSRRDIWESRAAAAAKFAQSKFYQAWDPRVLDLWIEHGLRELPTELYPSLSSASLANINSKGQAELGTRKEDKPVTLTTTKHQELFTYLRPTYRRPDAYPVPDMDPAYDVVNPRGYPFYRPEPFHVFRRLPELRPSVLYVFGGQSDISTPELRRAKMQNTGTGVGGSGGVDKGRVEEVVLDCGHLVAMEKVGECAEAMAGFLEREVGRWRTQRNAVEAARKGRERREVIMIDERWKEEIKPRGKGEAKL